MMEINLNDSNDLCGNTSRSPDVVYSILTTTPPLTADATMRLTWPMLPLKISLALLGVACNSLVFVGLISKRKKMQAPDILLFNLAFWDTVFLGSRACQHIMHAVYRLCRDQSTCTVMFVFYLGLTYVARTSLITSMLSTIPIAVERCWCSFLSFKVTNNYGMRRARLVLLVVAVVPLVISVPEVQMIVCIYHVYPESILAVDHTDWPLCSSSSFELILKSGQLLRLGTKILSWICLLVLDSVLIYRLLSGARLAKKMHAEECRHSRSYHERSLTLAVVALVFIALIAYPVTGLVWANIYTNPSWNGLVDPRLMTDLHEAGRVTQIVNASSNLLFLLGFGTRFRRNLVQRLSPLIGCRQKTPRPQREFD